MPIIRTDTERRIFKKATSMLVVPYVYDSTVGDYILGEVIYDISAIIGDSIVLEQSEGNATAKENEFTNEPIIVSHSGSKYGFTAQCLDVQDSVLKALYGALTASNRDDTPEAVMGAVALKNDFTEMYALIRIRFEDETMPDMILPKVQMSNRLLLQQFKTRAGQGNITGQPMSYPVSVKDEKNEGYLLQFSSPSTFLPNTPVLLLPKGLNPIFAKTNNATEFFILDFDSGNKTTVYLDLDGGTWSTIPV